MGKIQKHWYFHIETIKKLDDILKFKCLENEADFITELINNEHKKINRIRIK